MLWGCLILTACRVASQGSPWISFFSPWNLIFETFCGLKKHRNTVFFNLPYADIISLYCYFGYHWWRSDMWLSLIHVLQMNKGALIFAVRSLQLGIPLHEWGQCICSLYLLTAVCIDQGVNLTLNPIRVLSQWVKWSFRVSGFVSPVSPLQRQFSGSITTDTWQFLTTGLIFWGLH